MEGKGSRQNRKSYGRVHIRYLGLLAPWGPKSRDLFGSKYGLNKTIKT